jgi:hypothetical protein
MVVTQRAEMNVLDLAAVVFVDGFYLRYHSADRKAGLHEELWPLSKKIALGLGLGLGRPTALYLLVLGCLLQSTVFVLMGGTWTDVRYAGAFGLASIHLIVWEEKH